MAMNEVMDKYAPSHLQFIWPFITKLEEVNDDGNCGYHYMDTLMGYDNENGWRKVCYDLQKKVLMY